MSWYPSQASLRGFAMVFLERAAVLRGWSPPCHQWSSLETGSQEPVRGTAPILQAAAGPRSSGVPGPGPRSSPAEPEGGGRVVLSPPRILSGAHAGSGYPLLPDKLLAQPYTAPLTFDLSKPGESLAVIGQWLARPVGVRTRLCPACWLEWLDCLVGLHCSR